MMRKIQKISGRLYNGHSQLFMNLVDEYRDIVWSNTRLKAYHNDRVEFEMAVVGRDYSRIRELVERLNTMSFITDSEFGILKDGTIQ